MPAKEPSPLERIQTSYKTLAASAVDLNTASDELTSVIATLDEALKSLQLGISAWAKISEGQDQTGEYYWSRDVGYAKIGKKWGIALRDVSGCYTDPDREDSET